MAAGKSTIGRHLARLLERPFVDTDELIVQRYGPIPQLFAERGEAGFRAVELEAVQTATAGAPAVIALGGGAVTHAPTRAALADAGALRVYLDISPAEILVRLRRSRTQRPMVGGAPNEQRIRELLAQRLPYYLESDLIVPGPQRTKAAFARVIAAQLAALSNLPEPP
jgi:shikimate kinase